MRIEISARVDAARALEIEIAAWNAPDIVLRLPV